MINPFGSPIFDIGILVDIPARRFQPIVRGIVTSLKGKPMTGFDPALGNLNQYPFPAIKSVSFSYTSFPVNE